MHNANTKNENLEHQNLKNNQNQNNKYPQLVQNDLIPNYKYPPLMQNPIMINQPQVLQLNQENYIALQIPQMTNNYQNTQQNMPIKPLTQNPLQVNDLDIENQINRNIQQRYADYTPNNQPAIDQQTMHTGIPTTDNLDQLQFHTYNNPDTDEQKQQQEKQKQQMNSNQIPVVIVQDVPKNPLTVSDYNQNLRVSRIQTLKPKTQAKQKTFVKQNTVSHKIVKSTDYHVYYFVDTNNYHENVICCNLLYADDCCLKWGCDLIFQLLFLPFRLFAYLIRALGSLCCKESSANCFECFKQCFYAPFECFGNWINQCWFSCSNFCCQGLDFIPNSISSIYTNCCQKCFMQVGQFFKNCCSFPANCNCCQVCPSECPDCPDCTSICKNSNGDYCCNDCCQCCGDCFQNCCTPQGFCEDVYKCCNNCSCDVINKDCCECICCCCVQIQKIEIGDQVGEIFKCCFCCICQTLGSVLEGIGN